MRKFNTSDLFTGYIKQLLHNFNLPKIKVYTEQHRQYALKNEDKNNINRESPEILGTLKASSENTIKNVRYFPYIKDGEIQEYINNEWKNVGDRGNIKIFRNYVYGEKILNYTKNLKINSNVYDSYTHEYLGDYLRFHRDFLNLDLMPLYNCFSNRSCDKLKLKWSLTNETNIVFDTTDTNFKIYMVPVKLFKKYTIAIDSEYPIEMCCGIYGDYQDTREKFNRIPRLTYKRVSNSIFSQPFLYDLLAYTDDNSTNTLVENLTSKTNNNDLIELAQNECDLKLFIKIPVENNSTIVVLEGDYLTWNDSYYAKESPKIFDIASYFTKLPTSLTESDLNKLYLVNSDEDKYINLYKVIKNKESQLVFENLGSIWGNSVKYSKESNQFKLIIDDASNADTIEEAYKNYIRGKIVSQKYIAYYNSSLKKLYVPSRTFTKKTNKTIINLDSLSAKKFNNTNISLKTQLQLLHLNTKEQHPFADRLIEYLIGNAITNAEDEIYDNVRRAQKALSSNYSANNYIISVPGVWSNEMKVLFYEYMTTNKLTNTFKTNHDILGYVDKDVEKYYQATLSNPKAKEKIKVSLSNIELEEGDK